MRPFVCYVARTWWHFVGRKKNVSVVFSRLLAPAVNCEVRFHVANGSAGKKEAYFQTSLRGMLCTGRRLALGKKPPTYSSWLNEVEEWLAASNATSPRAAYSPAPETLAKAHALHPPIQQAGCPVEMKVFRSGSTHPVQIIRFNGLANRATDNDCRKAMAVAERFVLFIATCYATSSAT